MDPSDIPTKADLIHWASMIFQAEEGEDRRTLLGTAMDEYHANFLPELAAAIEELGRSRDPDDAVTTGLRNEIWDRYREHVGEQHALMGNKDLLHAWRRYGEQSVIAEMSPVAIDVDWITARMMASGEELDRRLAAWLADEAPTLVAGTRPDEPDPPETKGTP
jgi:hypothetical protein